MPSLGHVDSRPCCNTIPCPCRPQRRHISFPRIVGLAMSSAQTSHLLPTYARVDLAFERGEGAWLVATNGDRYLDLPRAWRSTRWANAHPQPGRCDHPAGQQGLACFQSLPHPRERARLAERLVRGELRGTWCSLAIPAPRAMECAIKMDAQIPIGERAGRKRYRIITFEGAFPRAPRSPRWPPGARKSISTEFGPVVEGFDQMCVRRSRRDQACGRARDCRDHESSRSWGEGGRGAWVPPRIPAGAAAAVRRKRPAVWMFRRGADRGSGAHGELFAYQRCGVTPDINGACQGPTVVASPSGPASPPLRPRRA